MIPVNPATGVDRHRITIPGSSVVADVNIPQIELPDPIPQNRLTTSSAWQNLTAVRNEIDDMLVNRKQELDMLLLALLTRQHVVLVGPPGVAKTLLCEAICESIAGAQLFTQLCSRTMDVADIMGHLDLAALHNKGIETLRVAGFLPTADIAFLDEIWNADGPVLNSLLRILNEREFWNGPVREKAPLQTLLAASNHYPDIMERSELRAIYDRFLFRGSVSPLVRGDHIQQLMFPQREPVLGSQFVGILTLDMLQELQAAARTTPFSSDAHSALLDLQNLLRNEGISLSDRRLALAPRVGQAAAVLDGCEEVLPRHLMSLRHVLWENQSSERSVAALVVKTVDPSAHELQLEIVATEEVLAEIDSDLRKPRTSELVATQTARLQKVAASMARIKQLAGAKTLTADETRAIESLRGRLQTSAFGIAGATLVSGMSPLTFKNK